MKKTIIKLSFIVVSLMLMISSCTKTPIEEAQDAYDYNAIIPKVLGMSGASVAIQTFTSDFTITYYRGGSTWNWSAEGATVSSVSDDSRIATIEFTNDGTATVTVTETTAGGKTSEPVSMDVTVMKYCPLTNGVADMVGAWAGTDGQGDDYTFESIITSEVSGTSLALTGISEGFINGFWGEGVIAGGTILATINIDGTVDVPRQFLYTTEYEGDPYDYEIEGSGTWDNCGSTPSLLINYDVYYAGEDVGLAEDYAAYLNDIPYLTANIAIDDTKAARVVNFVTKKVPVVK